MLRKYLGYCLRITTLLKHVFRENVVYPSTYQLPIIEVLEQHALHSSYDSVSSLLYQVGYA